MRFETDVLTLSACSCGCSGWPYRYEADGPCGHNHACRDAIVCRGWLLPHKIGFRIVLVFSTTHVRGASRCLGTDLAYAGLQAMKKVGLERSGTLWWWPCIVTGPK